MLVALAVNGCKKELGCRDLFILVEARELPTTHFKRPVGC